MEQQQCDWCDSVATTMRKHGSFYTECCAKCAEQIDESRNLFFKGQLKNAHR